MSSRYGDRVPCYEAAKVLGVSVGDVKLIMREHGYTYRELPSKRGRSAHTYAIDDVLRVAEARKKDVAARKNATAITLRNMEREIMGLRSELEAVKYLLGVIQKRRSLWQKLFG